jgi:hypothetical protein
MNCGTTPLSKGVVGCRAFARLSRIFDKFLRGHVLSQKLGEMRSQIKK